MPLSWALRFWVCDLVPWHSGSPDQFMCVCRLYMAWNQASFLKPPLHMPYPDRGVVWRSVQSVFTRLSTRLSLTFPPSRICA